VQEERNRFAWLEERYRIVARESDDVIFEISLQEKFIEANENFHKLLGYNVVQWNNEYLNRVHPDDEQKFAAIYEGIKAGKRLMKEELRFRRADGTYVWCRLLIAILFDSKGKPARALGKITNIDSQKREAAWLRQKAQQDALTNLYNKETTHNMIRRYLETEGVGGVHGLMVLDVDNFKEINDTRGHLYGDVVLAAVADKLRMQFRSTDIVGRIGGDEFLVFLKNVNSRTQLETQAAALQHAFASGKELDYRISCSIGAATYPEDGAGIDLLFQNADTALYRAKRQGKGRYAIFRWDIDARQQTEKPRSVQPESKEQSDSGEGNDIQQ
jgi:diguanylate cyclase (GGDEF)-like protein/PAS domain S-box-containing protein